MTIATAVHTRAYTLRTARKSAVPFADEHHENGFDQDL